MTNGLALAASLIVTSMVAPAIANVFVGSRMLANVSSLSSGIVMLDFDSGTQLPLGGAATWDAGTTTDTITAADGSLTLAHNGQAPPSNQPTWWDPTWSSRQCFVMDNPGASTTEFPVEIELDTATPLAAGDIQADGSGLRAVASDSGLELPLWIEGQIPNAATDIWVQLANAPTGPSEFCLYWGNPAAAGVSSQSSVFTFTTPRIRYYTLTDSYTGGAGVGGQLSVVSYANGNSVTVDGVTQVGNRGQMLTFNNVNRNSVVTATAPLSGSGLGNATDSIVPESYGDTEFIFPTTRQVQTIWVRAPFGPVDLEFRHGNTVTSRTVTPAEGSVGVVSDAAGANAVGGTGEGTSVRSTNGVPFLAMNTSQNNDSILGVPFTGEPLFGMRSRDLRIGAGFHDATFALLGSDGTDLPNESVAAGFIKNYYQPTDLRGDGTGFRVTPISGRTAAVQQADGNSSESTAFVPYSLLDYEYFLPQDATYISIVCPVPGQGVIMTPPGTGATSFPCDNPGGVAGAPGRAFTTTTGSAVIPAGTLLQSSLPFFAYSEEAIYNDETNLVGALAANPRSPISLGTTAGPVEGMYLPSGSFSSATIDTGASGSYGYLDLVGSLPAGSTARLQIASGADAASADAATPVGPDGTASTFYEIGSDIVASMHEGNPFIRFTIELTSTDPFSTPAIAELRLATDLVEFATSSTGTVVVPIAGGPGLASHRIARFSTDTTLDYAVRVSYTGGSGLPDATTLRVRTDHPETHVEATSGAIVLAAGGDQPHLPGDAFDLLLDEDIAAGSTVTLEVTVTFEATSGLVLQKDVTFVITG